MCTRQAISNLIFIRVLQLTHSCLVTRLFLAGRRFIVKDTEEKLGRGGVRALQCFFLTRASSRACLSLFRQVGSDPIGG
jgi:hypothetical protein